MQTKKTKAKQEATNTSKSQLNGGENAKEKTNLDYSVEPFEIRQHPEKGTWLVMLTNMVVHETKTENEAVDAIAKPSWDMMLTVISAVIEITQKLQEMKKQAEAINKLQEIKKEAKKFNTKEQSIN